MACSCLGRSQTSSRSAAYLPKRKLHEEKSVTHWVQKLPDRVIWDQLKTEHIFKGLFLNILIAKYANDQHCNALSPFIRAGRQINAGPFPQQLIWKEAI